MNVPQPPVTVRIATIEDADRLGAIWRESIDTLSRLDPRIQVAPDGSDRWRAAFLADLLLTDRRTVIAARGNHVMGAMMGAILPNAPGLLPDQIGAIVNLMVDAHGQGGGIGTSMFKALSEWFTANRITSITVEVPSREPIAQAFWRALGASGTADKMVIKPRV